MFYIFQSIIFIPAPPRPAPKRITPLETCALAPAPAAWAP